MKKFECRIPARVRRALTVATAVAKYFYGEAVEVERIVEQGSEVATGIGVFLSTPTGQACAVVHLRKHRGYKTEFWAVVGLEVGGRSFWDEALCELSDRIPDGLPHLGLEHVRERDSEQLPLPGVVPEPTQGHLPLGHRPHGVTCYG